jgi:hypothetical protein
MKMSNNVKISLEKKKPVLPDKPEKPEKDSKGITDEVDEDAYKEELKIYAKERREYNQSMKTAYSILYGQCSESVRARLQAMKDHDDLAEKGEPIGLLKNIQSIMTDFQSTKYIPHAIYDAKRKLYLYNQAPEQTVSDYYNKFKGIVEVIEHNGGTLADIGLVRFYLEEEQLDITSASAEEKRLATEKARNAMVGCAFIIGADKTRFGKLKEDLQNSYTQDDDKYPKDLIGAYKLLTNWKQDPRNLIQLVQHRHPGNLHGNNHPRPETNTTVGELALANIGSEAGSITEQMTFATRGNRENIQCYNCQQMGHFADECTNARVERERPVGQINGSRAEPANDVQMLMNAVVEEEDSVDFAFTTTDGDRIKLPRNWILLDNQSTVHIFYNKALLRNIHAVKDTVIVQCNAGTTTTNMIGHLPGFGAVWYHPSGIANILSFAKVAKDFHITYDKTNGFTVHKEDGAMRRFAKSERGLYYLDVKKNEGNHVGEPSNDITLLNTVSEKKSKYTARDYRLAELARKLQVITGRYSTRDYMDIVDNNLLKNCPITRKDIMRAEDIFGPEIGSLQGKTPRQKAPQVKHAFVHVPPEIHEIYQRVTIAMDIMFVNKLAFFVTISHKLKLGSAEYITDRKEDTIMQCVKRVRSMYKLGGFTLAMVHADKEFEVLRTGLAEESIGLNTASEDEHVGEIERYIRTVKERTRALENTLPFKQFTNRLMIEMVRGSVFWLNSFPAKDGVSDKISPRSMITGETIDYNNHCRIEFGAYVHTHEKHDNTMKSRTVGALALQPTGNAQGGNYFLSLSTGRRIDRQHWTELPMPDDVIDRVHILARRDRAATGLTFGWRDGTPVADDTDDAYYDDADSNYDPADNTENDIDYDDYMQNVEDPTAGAPPQPHTDNDNDDDPPDLAAPVDEEEGDDDDDDDDNDGNSSGDDGTPGVDDTTPGVGDTTPGVGERNAASEATRYRLRPVREPNYDKHLGIQPVNYGLFNAEISDIEHSVFTQYSVKRGLKEFGEAGAEAVIKEMQQLDRMKVGEPTMASMMTRAEKKASLEYLMFLKKKRCGRIKGRGCADGRKQRLYTNKEDTSSPTVTTEGLFLSCVIDAKEGRDVATADIPGAFMQADMDETVFVRMAGPLAKLLTRVDPNKYGRFVTMENGKPVIYIRLLKALYGTLQAALLFWKDLSSLLKKWGFTINPYDECVANKTINGKQCTILWHVDDLKISHIDSTVVDQILVDLNERYGEDAPLTVTRGKLHDYLGMTIDFSMDGKVQIRMDDYVDDLLLEAKDDPDATKVSSPAGEHLFEVNTNDPELVNDEDKQYFHTMTAKLLFLSKRSRPDLQQAVAFLTTRVRKTDKDDMKKLARAIKYLRAEPHLDLTLEADDTKIMKWWIDASFAVHPDMKSHTGGTMSMGKGSIYSTSTRQKLNTTSSTEAELVGVSDLMPMILWTRYFLEAQGYGVGTSTIYQDNQSSILLEKNGRRSSGRRTRHINIRYFFVADRVRAKEVDIEYCHTDLMLADYLTKPLQGSKFLGFRNEILNIQTTLRDHGGRATTTDEVNPSTGVC